ncbi:MAG TPA: VOC family protein [Actinomycetota bacterium]|nr:VOC family protein [Actinomycetota bacterium]
MGHPVAHFEVMGANPARLREFYTGIFGWSTKYPPRPDDPLEYTMISTGSSDQAIEGGIGKAQQGSRFLTFYVSVGDLAATLAEVEARGGATVLPPTQVGPAVAIAQFTDPDGNVVGLLRQG